MFARSLARLAAALPAPIKFSLTRVRGPYTALMSAGQPAIEVRCKAGTFRWRIDARTSQRHLLGTYEPYMQDALLKYIRPGDTVYDVGANVGFHSLFAALLVEGGRVLSFEPNAWNLVSLKAHVAANPTLRIVVYEHALSDRCGVAQMVEFGNSSQCGIVDGEGEATEAKTIDSLVLTGQVPAPNLIKIDVEGHEVPVLRGAKETLNRYGPVVCCDYNDGTTLPTVKELLSPKGYVIFPGPPIVAVPHK